MRHIKPKLVVDKKILRDRLKTITKTMDDLFFHLRLTPYQAHNFFNSSPSAHELILMREFLGIDPLNLLTEDIT